MVILYKRAMKMLFARSIIFLFILESGLAARILGIFPILAKSHFSCSLGVMRNLDAAGHHVTMIHPFPLETGIENFTNINSRTNNTFNFIGQSSVNDVDHLSLFDFWDIVLEREISNCHDVMNLPAIQEVLHSKRKLYDVMFVELMLSHECYLPIAQKLGIPVIGVITFHSWKLADHFIGLPNNPAVIPSEYGDIKCEMIIDRIRNLWYNFLIDYYWRPRSDKKIGKFHQNYFTENLLQKKDISLIFYNNHDSLLPRPMPANAINIGGIHLVPAKPLPKDLLKFIDEASSGVVLFSFGSMISPSKSLSLEQRNTFLEAFRSIPQRVIWKFEGKIENLPENILLQDWIPQRDILEHKNVIAFITHCGLSGVYEAVATGTPVVTIPLFGDQFSNARTLIHRNVGVSLDYKTITKQKILTALNGIINDTSYYERMQKLSLAFKDRPMSPQESIIYWTEYVIRHNGTPFLRALGTDMPLYKYLMLDIIALAALIVTVVFFAVCTLAKKLFTSVGKKSNYSSAKKDN